MIEYIEDDIKEVMDITGLDKTKAEKLFKSVARDIDDGSDDEICSYDVIDVIKVEHKAKLNGVNSHYETSDKPKAERKPREVKIDPIKVKAIEAIAEALKVAGFDNVNITNTQKYVSFYHNGENYEINLVRHKKKK